MSEQLSADCAVIYKIFCDVAKDLEVDFSNTSIQFNQEEAFENAFDYVEDLYDEGIGEEVTTEQVNMLALIAVCNKAWLIFDDGVLPDGRNFND